MKEISAFMIAGTHSGCGKTTVSIGIMAFLKKMGLSVQAFKIGPDFIDPGHHRRVTGRPSHNLDGWMMSKEYNQRIFSYYCQDADVAVVEAVMGLYDGFSGKSEEGSSSQMAKWLNLPVILVVDASSMARSAAAIVLGYKMFDPKLNICGVIFNKVAGEKHEKFIREAMEKIDIEIIGFLKRRDEIIIPSRHLGLVTAEDLRINEKETDLLSEWIGDGLDMEKLLRITSGYKIHLLGDEGKKEKRVRIGVARDNAFCFYYEENLRLLEKEGAEIILFSPLRDESLPKGISGLIFGGGYPEIYARELSENRRLIKEIKDMAERGMPIYAECGGFMYLMEEIDEYRMAGIFPFRCRFQKRLVALGYREIVTKKDSIIGPSMTRARGHEFHYSNIVNEIDGVETIYRLKEKSREGFLKKNTLGSYIHLHFGSNPNIPKNFVNSCEKFMHSFNYIPLHYIF